jgi:hypothetical protein
VPGFTVTGVQRRSERSGWKIDCLLRLDRRGHLVIDYPTRRARQAVVPGAGHPAREWHVSARRI